MKWKQFADFSMKSLRPALNALNNGRVQKRVRGAYRETGRPVLSASELLAFTHLHPGVRPGVDREKRDKALRSVHFVCVRYCERVGRGSTRGRPILWRYLG